MAAGIWVTLALVLVWSAGPGLGAANGQYLKHYARLLYRADHIEGPEDIEVPTREPPARLPRGVYAWQVYDRWESRTPDGMLLKSDAFNVAPTHYVSHPLRGEINYRR